jgi:hypothetical protein
MEEKKGCAPGLALEPPATRRLVLLLGPSHLVLIHVTGHFKELASSRWSSNAEASDYGGVEKNEG